MSNIKGKCARIDCFANKCGAACVILTEGYEKDSECPFYKTVEQYEQDRKDAHDILVEKGRYDLINTYEYNAKSRNSHV